jgi:hypothetical protein
MVISFIPHLHGHVFESARVLGNFYLNCLTEKMKGKEKKKNRVNQHPRWYLHLLLVGPLIDHINLKNGRFELRDPDLLLAGDIYNIQK